MRRVSTPPPFGPQHPQDPQGPPGRNAAAQPQRAWPPPQSPHPGTPACAPYGLYGPHGPRPPAAVNGVAVAALVLGVLCFLPAVGLVLGLIAVRQIRRRGERGRGMAVAGSVLSSLGLALWVVSLSTGVAADVWQGFKDGALGRGVMALRKGDCFTSPGGLQGWTSEADTVPCAGRHDGEVFAVVTRPDGPYPGDDRLTDLADERCYALQDAYVMDDWALPGDVAVYHLVPSRQSWRYGDREITCVFGDEDGRSPLTGSLRRDRTTLDAHQIAFLKAARVLGTALDTTPEGYPSGDFAQLKAWAGRVCQALDRQVGMLRGHTWPAAAKRPVGELVADLDKARREWARASRAADADAYHRHHDKGWDLIDPQGSVTARKALGLAASPPDAADDPERRSEGGAIEV